MARTLAQLSASLLFLSGVVLAQGLTTTATKDDWEEINFESNSAVLTDGYPSLLRLAELLNKTPGYKVKVTGHADSTESLPDKLALKRAQAVQQFLEKYGARPGQVTAESKGKNDPKVDNRTKEGRFINRRADMIVTDPSGKRIGDPGTGGVGDAIKALEAIAKKQEECCSMILKKLDKLDEIIALIKQLKDQNDKLSRDVAELKGQGGRGGPGAAGTQGAAGTGAGPSGADLDKVAEKAARKAVDDMHHKGPGGPQFTLLGLNAGPDSNGKATFTGKARFFAPLSQNSAVQAEGEYMYFNDRKEGQFDLGLVERWKHIQMGEFASFKTVGLKDMQNNATLGQFSVAADYLFKGGRIGAFGTKAFLDNTVVGRTVTNLDITQETYLRVNDQIGAQGAVQLSRRAYLEANLGYIHSHTGNSKPGSTIRLVFPISRLFALSAEGGINETLITKDTTGSARFGIMFGNYMQPKNYVETDHPVPMEIPRVRYEILTRKIVTGHTPPVADAGPDQTVPTGTVQLDGSGSFSPDGDTITFLWSQIAGPAVQLSDPKSAKPTFNAATAGSMYSFKLTVTDSKGSQGIGRVTITTRTAPNVRIIRFAASLPVIDPNGTSTLNYLVQNADTVTISGITQTLNASTGTIDVKPTMTTTYTLTARNKVSEDTAVVTVVVNNPPPRIIVFQANPATIMPNGKSVLSWQTLNADSVEIPNVGSFQPNGSVEVMPRQNTAYVLIARNKYGEATASTVVNIQPRGPRPRIVAFSANPMQILTGDSSTLTWNVTGADTVTITSLGTVKLSDSAKVSPTATTTYTLTATNAGGTSTATATVEVIPRVKIVSFTANPTTINAPGQPVTYTWQTENCQSVFIDGGIGTRPCNGSLTNAGPLNTQTYTLTATGRGSNATATVTITFVPPAGPAAKPPQAIVAQSEIVTSFRDLVLNAAQSFDPQGQQLTFNWVSLDGNSDILNPTSATPTVRLRQANYGDFRFQVTVTNQSGLTSTANVRVTLVLARPLF